MEDIIIYIIIMGSMGMFDNSKPEDFLFTPGLLISGTPFYIIVANLLSTNESTNYKYGVNMSRKLL